MNIKRGLPEQVSILPQIIKWVFVASLVGVLAGGASAAFLSSLNAVTRIREAHFWIVLLLPLAGLAIGLTYTRHGREVEPGSNLLIDEIHDPQKVTPFRMAPLIFVSTVVTHLFGGSAGREGTAVQMGGSLADQLTRLFRLTNEDRRIVLMAGISAGFASVFGTPLAGAIFGLEVLSIGRLRYDAILPCFIAAIVGDQITLGLRIVHTPYHVPFVPPALPVHLLSAIAAGIAFGIIGALFSKLTHQVGRVFQRLISRPQYRPLVGGLLLTVIVFSIGGRRYLGLGIPTLTESFLIPVRLWDFAAKIFFTALTLGSGFKGGEVTPLFFIGATLGNALSHVLSLPLPVLAALGFVGVFAGAANTPITCTLMAMELFGAPIGVFAAIACVMSYLFSGHSGIYQSQRIGLPKNLGGESFEGLTLSGVASARLLPVVDLFEDLHFFGFLVHKEKKSMNSLCTLRVYFHHGAKVQRTGFLARLTAPSLGAYLASLAKAEGIEQVIQHRVSLGFMNGDRLNHDLSEITPHKLPQCLELVDSELALRKFAKAHLSALSDIRIVMLRCEDPLVDNAAIGSLEANNAEVSLAAPEVG